MVGNGNTVTGKRRLFYSAGRGGYLLTEAILALALLGMVAGLIIHFETRAAGASRRLERQYTATVAAESQFERLKAGLKVLDPEAFRSRYPGLEMTYRVEPARSGAKPVAVVTVSSREENPVRFTLSGPLPTSAVGLEANR